ncbi:MAG TPA: tRNA guanosine(34) transglycosylase Tgt [Gammaproteobacteria bacterium]|jgi:queuine tRNA-ribosyltransferase|nr:tRNA guanosine(34) transglycosylase Tgt [Gammaproteobacteria bacterium]
MLNIFKSEVIKKHPTLPARITKVTTPHGEFLTPTFMPVGTRAFVNLMSPVDLKNAGSQIILGGNTYHMLCAPGLATIQAMGGMHRFMGWDKPMLTDSGGFQVFSLSKNKKICKIDDIGAHFKHPLTGATIHLTPETSIQAQKVIGADIIMVFDECTPEEGGREAALAAMERTHRWLQESIEYHMKDPNSAYGKKQALFGIIQGGSFLDLREKSAEQIVNANVDGIAIGGEVIGYNMDKTIEVIDHVLPLLPENKTRYTMGVGLNPEDLIRVSERGIDIYDCVAPTRNARHGTLYCGKIVKQDHWLHFEKLGENGKISIKKSTYSKDENPIMPDCQCYTCRHFSRAYLHFLFKQQSMAYANLASIHNIHVMHEICATMRSVILQNGECNHADSQYLHTGS